MFFTDTYTLCANVRLRQIMVLFTLLALLDSTGSGVWADNWDTIAPQIDLPHLIIHFSQYISNLIQLNPYEYCVEQFKMKWINLQQESSCSEFPPSYGFASSNELPPLVIVQWCYQLHHLHRQYKTRYGHTGYMRQSLLYEL